MRRFELLPSLNDVIRQHPTENETTVDSISTSLCSCCYTIPGARVPAAATAAPAIDCRSVVALLLMRPEVRS